MSIRIFSILVPVFLVAGCVSVPEPLEGEYPDFYPDQTTERSVGAQVRWGGTVVETRPGQDATCVEILARPLDQQLRPMLTDDSHGRFQACREDFLDPEVFTNGREVTVVGEISGFTEGEVGEYTYRYPQLASESIYLWTDERQLTRHYPYYYPHHGFYPYYFHGPYRFHHPHRHHFGFHGRIHIRR